MNNYDDILNNTPADERQGGKLPKEEYAAKKQAERESLYELSDNTALEVAGDGDRFRLYLDVQGRFPRYSAVNALLILAQKPEASQIGDFGYWKGRGGSVKAQQTGFHILEPHEYIKDDGTPGVGYNLKSVFDISQVDTRKIKAEPMPNYSDRQLLAALVNKAPMKISSVDELPGTLGAVTEPETGEISVRRGMGFTDTFRSLAQELGYYEADRDSDKIPANPSFVGYCAAYILCKKYGVETHDFEFAAAPGIFSGLNPQGVKRELSIIRDAADAISGRMAKQLETAQKAARGQEAR